MTQPRVIWEPQLKNSFRVACGHVCYKLSWLMTWYGRSQTIMGSSIPASSYGQEGWCKKARKEQSREQASKWHSSVFQPQIPALSFNPSFPQGYIVTWKWGETNPFLPSCFKSECSVIATENKLGQWLSVVITLRSINKAQTNNERNNEQKEFK